MSAETILVTGGAGFIGQHLCRALLAAGYSVKVLDSFQAQVHGSHGNLATDLEGEVELMREDVRNTAAMSIAVRGVDAVVHLAADTGTGQSMYEIERYFDVNVQGTAVLLAAVQKSKGSDRIRSIVVASSRAVYGEGAYSCVNHGTVYPDGRTSIDLAAGSYEPRCPFCETIVVTRATDESAPFKPMSIYGLTKQVQEQAVLMCARTLSIVGIALRYQNVYGPGQSLRNPYTGILAVFSNLARQGQAIELYEDGLESRDFVFVADVVEATSRAISVREKFAGAINIGYGAATTVETVANEINGYFGGKSAVQVTGAFRVGDIRHNSAWLGKAAEILNFRPDTQFRSGIRQFLSWAESQEMGDKNAYAMSVAELTSQGLMHRRAP